MLDGSSETSITADPTKATLPRSQTRDDPTTELSIKLLVQDAAEVEIPTRGLLTKKSLCKTIEAIQTGALEKLREEAGHILGEMNIGTLISKGSEAEFTVAKHVVHLEAQGVNGAGLHIIDSFMRHSDTPENQEAVAGILNHIGFSSNNMMTRLYAAVSLQELGEASMAAEVFGSMLQDESIHPEMVEEVLDRVETLSAPEQRGTVGGLLVLAESSDLAVPISVRQRADRILDELLPNR